MISQDFPSHGLISLFLVEDNTFTRGAFESTVSKMQNVRLLGSAVNAEDFRAAWGQVADKVNVIFMDNDLGSHSETGTQLAQWIRSQGFKDVFIVSTSSDNTREGRPDSSNMHEGYNWYTIQKPISVLAISQHIDRWKESCIRSAMSLGSLFSQDPSASSSSSANSDVPLSLSPLSGSSGLPQENLDLQDSPVPVLGNILVRGSVRQGASATTRPSEGVRHEDDSARASGPKASEPESPRCSRCCLMM